MRLFQTLKISVSMLICVLFVFGTAVLVYPLLQSIFEVQLPEKTEGALPYVADKPEAVRVQLLCVLNEQETEFTAFYLEILNNHAESVFYFEVPAHTKVTISQELYRKLQVYAPELPQYLKLSKLPGSFSENYRMEGSLKIFEEVLGIPIAHWSCMKEAVLQEWMEAVFETEKNASGFFGQYKEFIRESASDQTSLERWMYYDAYRGLTPSWEGTVPGAEGVGEFELYGLLTKETLENCIKRTEKKK